MAKGIFVDNTKVKKIYVDNAKIKKVYVDNTLMWTSAIAQDVGMKMNSCSIHLGNGTHNPISGGTANNWSICFSFVWHGGQGGALLYHNYNQRESGIWLLSDGRIMVNANRYDTSNYKTWYSTKLCQVGKLNRVAVTRLGRIYINGEDATPSTYGGDMTFWGELTLFPDRDINGTCLGVNSWNWNLETEHIWVTGRDYPHETDASTFAMSFNNSITFRLNALSGALKSTTGTPTYATYEWNEDREASKV